MPGGFSFGVTGVQRWREDGAAKARLPRRPVGAPVEAILINTAGGLIVAIAGIVAYNVFVTKVDNFNYMMDEASYEAVQLLSASTEARK